jgi:hypothetical protein
MLRTPEFNALHGQASDLLYGSNGVACCDY